MNHMTQNVSSAIAQCRRFTQYLTSNLMAQGSIQLIISYAQAVDNFTNKLLTRLRHAHVIHMLDRGCTLLARAFQRLTASPLGLARWVAIVIGISLSIPMVHADSGSIEPIITLKQLASYQLTDAQYKCHNAIVYRESRFKADAVNGSHHGYYQGRSTALIGKSDEYQFYWFWSYVAHRYGVTEYDEPDYCAAYNHLTNKGWQ